MSVEDDSRRLTQLVAGERVILRDAQRGTIELVALESGEPSYTVRMTDGSRRVVGPDDLIQAKAYAEWAAPGTDWSGEERRMNERRVEEPRIDERRTSERATAERRVGERRKDDRRRP